MPLPHLNLNLGVYSPYGPRRRRSAKLVVVWILGFFFLVFVMWYLPSLDRSRARSGLGAGSVSSGLREGVRMEEFESYGGREGVEAVEDGVVGGKGKGKGKVKSVRFGAGGANEEGG